MRLSFAAVLAGLAFAPLMAGSALAQGVGLGAEVQVNPIAAGGGVLLYPGGQYMRVVRPLLVPGQTLGPIRLHMPARHAARPHTDQTAAAAKPKPKPRHVAAATPAPAAAAPAAPPAPAAPSGSIYYGFGGNSAASLTAGGGASALNPAPASKPAPKAPPKTQLAKAEPAPAATAEPGLTKRSVILFAPKASDPAESALGAIKFLAGDLNTAMTSAGSRIQIQAFGGAHGDKSSDARRLSLKRALAIRQVLIDDGVPSERIDVRAMGGADDSGPADRVDVYVKA